VGRPSQAPKHEPHARQARAPPRGDAGGRALMSQVPRVLEGGVVLLIKFNIAYLHMHHSCMCPRSDHVSNPNTKTRAPRTAGSLPSARRCAPSSLSLEICCLSPLSHPPQFGARCLGAGVWGLLFCGETTLPHAKPRAPHTTGVPPSARRCARSSDPIVLDLHCMVYSV